MAEIGGFVALIILVYLLSVMLPQLDAAANEQQMSRIRQYSESLAIKWARKGIKIAVNKYKRA